MSATNVSPFTFITWKEDEHAIVAGTSNTNMGYIQLLTIDGIDVDEIIEHAVSVNGESALTDGLATHFPEYVSAVAAKKGTPCFVTSKKAAVEYADLNTGEVSDSTFDATEANYNESVRVDTARGAYDKKEGKTSHKAGAEGEEEEDDDDYEDVDDEEDEEEVHGEQNAYMAKRRLFDMVSTQLETAMTISFDLGLTVEEIQAAYKAAVPGPFPVPQTPEECLAFAEKDPALMAYLSQLSTHGGGGAGGAGMPAGAMPEGMPEGMPAGCPQQ